MVLVGIVAFLSLVISGVVATRVSDDRINGMIANSKNKI